VGQTSGKEIVYQDSEHGYRRKLKAILTGSPRLLAKGGGGDFQENRALLAELPGCGRKG
jgi:hypothetical protein